MRVITFDAPRIEFAPARPLPYDFLRELGAALREITGLVWQLRAVEGQGAPTLREAAESAREAERNAVLASPLVAAALESFPDAELIGWNRNRSNQA